MNRLQARTRLAAMERARLRRVHQRRGEVGGWLALGLAAAMGLDCAVRLWLAL